MSDAFDPSLLNPDDLEREMKELGMDNNEELPEWERELQKELQVGVLNTLLFWAKWNTCMLTNLNQHVWFGRNSCLLQKNSGTEQVISWLQ